jgi:hypothetical protein
MDQLSDENVEKYESCFFCGKLILMEIKVDKPITFGERLKLQMHSSGEIWGCKKCSDEILNKEKV